MNDAPSTVGLIIFLTALGLLPFIIVTMTAFLKISVVMFIVRNALGLQQTPPTLVLYSIALILTVFVSLPLMEDVSIASPRSRSMSARSISSRHQPMW